MEQFLREHLDDPSSALTYVGGGAFRHSGWLRDVLAEIEHLEDVRDIRVVRAPNFLWRLTPQQITEIRDAFVGWRESNTQ